MTDSGKIPVGEPNPNGPNGLGVAEEFYDARFRRGYMESWPDEKCARISNLLRELPLATKGRVLDFGCGTGVFTGVLKNTYRDWEVDGTDISGDALEIARSKLPGCRFYRLADCENLLGRFDLIFTHHVLEHVSDLPRTADFLANLLKPTGAMLHILPCADQGSLEHKVCMLRRDGIRGNIETRFFFDEEGHLRRLGIQGLVDLWSASGFRLERAYYANRRYGGLRFLTGNGLRFVLDFADPKAAISPSAANQLRLLRLALILIWAMRKPADIVRNKMRFGLNSLRDYLVLAMGVTGYPMSKCVEWLMNKLADREWLMSRQTPGGSEMYVFLVRQAP